MGANGTPIGIIPDQRVRRTIIGKDGQVVVPGIATEKGKDGVIALPPVGSVDLMVGIDLRTVVEAVAVAGEGVN